VARVQGGYKAWRSLVVDRVQNGPIAAPVIVLDGNTGSAKTAILQRLAQRGHQVIDLEGLANHRGSLFGAMPGGQPGALETAVELSACPSSWNKRGAMVTDRYQHVRHHEDVAAFAVWADAANLPVIAIDNVEGSRPLPEADLPQACVLLFGQEGPGLSAEALAAASGSVEIAQYGSTRSINAAAAAAVVMYEWCRRWA